MLVVKGIFVDKVRGVSSSFFPESAWTMHFNPDSKPYPTFRDFWDLIARERYYKGPIDEVFDSYWKTLI
jgi:hypothetical protein